MSFDVGIDFRHTSGYVTDPSNCTYALDSDSYPTTRGGATFGWQSAPGGGADRNSAVDARLAGINFAINPTSFELDLPAAGNYNFSLAMGDAISSQSRCIVKVYDNTTLLLTIGEDNPASGSFYDATNTEYTAANWPSSETPVSLTFASTKCIVTIGNFATNTTLAHIRLTSTGGASGSLFRQCPLTGLGTGGPFFSNPIG